MLSLASAGCTVTPAVAVVPPAATVPMPVAPVAPEWWRQAGDPVLARLVQQGLGSSEEIACRISGLRQFDLHVAQEEKRIGTKFNRLFRADQKIAADARARAREAREQRVVARRIDLARQIALDYVEVRRLQEEIALRSGLHDQYKDNAEVAQFRREAGLVSAIDGALAQSQDEAAQGELGFAQARLGEVVSRLARLIGDTPEAVVGKMGPPGPVLTPPNDAPSARAPENARRTALADDIAREARLVRALEQARRTVRDARGAYRQGAGEFTTLYVAEAAVTAVNLALVNVRANRMTATLELWSEQDTTWANRGLEPVVAGQPMTVVTTSEIADCD
jgi:outer membrane protein TolC